MTAISNMVITIQDMLGPKWEMVAAEKVKQKPEKGKITGPLFRSEDIIDLAEWEDSWQLITARVSEPRRRSNWESKLTADLKRIPIPEQGLNGVVLLLKGSQAGLEVMKHGDRWLVRWNLKPKEEIALTPYFARLEQAKGFTILSSDALRRAFGVDDSVAPEDRQFVYKAKCTTGSWPKFERLEQAVRFMEFSPQADTCVAEIVFYLTLGMSKTIENITSEVFEVEEEKKGKKLFKLIA